VHGWEDSLTAVNAQVFCICYPTHILGYHVQFCWLRALFRFPKVKKGEAKDVAAKTFQYTKHNRSHCKPTSCRR
jgi:hypothetical protein